MAHKKYGICKKCQYITVERFPPPQYRRWANQVTGGGCNPPTCCNFV